MNNYNKLLNNLETLKLRKFKDNLDEYIDMINNKKKDIVEGVEFTVDQEEEKDE